MCGLTGYWDTEQASTQQQLQAVTHDMCEALLHRGPDASGTWADAATGVTLGHRRLAILDLSPHGAQPMHSAHERFVIVYNGEIYNHLELKRKLTSTGNAVKWRGHSDTEVILAGFEAWGVHYTVEQMVGMFAIVVWDRQSKLLYLIRDRLGEKPLYYGWLGKHFVFASELKSLRAHPAWQLDVDPNAVALLMRYNCIPAPYSIHTNIRKLEPGHMLILNSEQAITDVAYWQLKDVINNPRKSYTFTSPQQAVDVLETNLKNTIKQQMMADVPVGAFLSGGIDSSTIVALMQTQSVQPVKTFTIGFTGDHYNEAEYAAAVAKHLHTQHTELYLSPDHVREIIPNLANLYDEPFADSSQLPTYIVAKLAREQVTVSLSGDGGDELFAGYNRYTWVQKIWRTIEFLPLPLRIALQKFILLLPPQYWNKVFALLQPLLPHNLINFGTNPGDKLHKLADILNSKSPFVIYQKLLSHWDTQNSTGLLRDLTQDLISQPITANMMYIDTMRYLPDDILVKVDRAAMAVSLETRIPFLDHNIVELAWAIPMEYKIRYGQSKWVLRELLKRHVPESLFTRPKMGFGVPIDAWLRGPLQEWAQDLLTPGMLAKHNLLDANLVQQKWREHLSGVRNWQYHLWDVLVFQAWYEEYCG